MPCLNAEKFIAQSIESALAQSFKDFELIIVDNGSEDSSPEIIQAYAEKDPRILALTCKDRGVSKARNKALEIAQGKYIALLDADDIWYPGKLAREIPVLEKKPEYIGSYSSVDYINESGVLEDKSHLKHFGYSGEIYLHLLLRNEIPNPSPILRKDSVLIFKGFREDLSYGEDWDLLLKLAYKAPFYYHSEPGGAYRHHKEQHTELHDVSAREEQALSILEEALAKLPCYLKKFKENKLKLPAREYKIRRSRPKLNLKRAINRAFKAMSTQVTDDDLQNSEAFKKRAYGNLYFRLAKAYREKGDKTNAKRCIKKALAYDRRRLFDLISLKLLLV